MLIDRFGPRRSLTIGLCLWSLAQTAAGAVGGLGQFIAARIALGVGEAPMYLSGTKVCTAWFHARDRAWPIGLCNASSALGPAIAPPLLTALMLGFGWRWMFAILGMAGAVVAIAWAVLYRDPETAGISEAEQGWIRSEDVHEEAKAPLAALRTLLRHRTSWFMALGFFGVVYMTWLYATWLPDYLETARGLTVQQAGIWAAVPMACGFFGALGGGGLSQALARRGVSPVASCTLPLIAAMVVTAICAMGTALVESTGTAILLVSVALFLLESRLVLRLGAGLGRHRRAHGRDPGGDPECRRLGRRHARPRAHRLGRPGHRIVHARAADRVGDQPRDRPRLLVRRA